MQEPPWALTSASEEQMHNAAEWLIKMTPEWMKDVDRWPRALPQFDFDPESTALMIVDMQNFCARADCGLGPVLEKNYPDMFEYYKNRLDTVMENTQKLLKFFRENGIFVRSSHRM